MAAHKAQSITVDRYLNRKIYPAQPTLVAHFLFNQSYSTSSHPAVILLSAGLFNQALTAAMGEERRQMPGEETLSTNNWFEAREADIKSMMEGYASRYRCPSPEKGRYEIERAKCPKINVEPDGPPGWIRSSSLLYAQYLRLDNIGKKPSIGVWSTEKTGLYNHVPIEIAGRIYNQINGTDVDQNQIFWLRDGDGDLYYLRSASRPRM